MIPACYPASEDQLMSSMVSKRPSVSSLHCQQNIALAPSSVTVKKWVYLAQSSGSSESKIKLEERSVGLSRSVSLTVVGQNAKHKYRRISHQKQKSRKQESWKFLKTWHNDQKTSMKLRLPAQLL